MTRIHSSISRLALLALAFGLGITTTATTASAAAATTSATASTDEKGALFGSVAVPAGLSKSDVQDAIVGALLGREWGVKSKADGTVVAYLKHRSNEATVTITYDTAKVDIYCVGYQIDKKTGVREKPEQPTGWLKNIQGDLTKNFNRVVTHR